MSKCALDFAIAENQKHELQEIAALQKELTLDTVKQVSEVGDNFLNVITALSDLMSVKNEQQIEAV